MYSRYRKEDRGKRWREERKKDRHIDRSGKKRKQNKT